MLYNYFSRFGFFKKTSNVRIFFQNFFNFLLILLLLLSSCTVHKTEQSGTPQRIISLAPSITETLFALGLSDKIRGVTTFCLYPPEAKKIDKIGSYTEINLEKIVTLKPDLVVLQSEHQIALQFLNRYKIRTCIVDYSSISAMCSTFVRIGRLCGVEARADSLVTTLTISESVRNDSCFKPKVLLCVGRNAPGAKEISGVFIAGITTYYNDLIRNAGGVNAFTETIPQYPQLSKEGIISLAPDIIIDIAPSMAGTACDQLVHDWDAVGMVPAVKNKHVFCLSNDYSTVPGPRARLLLDDFAAIITSVKNEMK